MPWFPFRGVSFRVWVLAVKVPAAGVVGDAFADLLQAFVVSGDMFVVVALPESLAEAEPPSCFHAAGIPHRGDGLERADHVTQRERPDHVTHRRGNPCGCPYLRCYRSRGRHKACPYVLSRGEKGKRLRHGSSLEALVFARGFSPSRSQQAGFSAMYSRICCRLSSSLTICS